MEAQFLDLPVYGLLQAEKAAFMRQELERLTRHHAANCMPYRRLLDAMGIDTDALPSELPAVTVRQFKHRVLKSIPDDAVFKTLLSSGTGGMPSTVVLDRDAASVQTKVLVKILQHWLGKERQPLLIVDRPGDSKDTSHFDARGAGIQGVSVFGRDHTYALRNDLSFDHESVVAFAARHAGSPVLIFGFTYMVWQHFVPGLAAAGLRFPEAVLLHGGGWKRLADIAVDSETFKAGLAEVGIRRVHNYYGMVEQTGAIFVECESGRFHAPVYSDIVFRDLETNRALGPGEEGVVEIHSILPHSYPGHVLLTEDIGILAGEDDCPCGLRGRTFYLRGRIPKAEARGCSDASDWSKAKPGEGLTVVAGTTPSRVSQATPLAGFSGQAIGFLSALSERLLHDSRLRIYPDLVALGFWLRPASLKAIEESSRDRTHDTAVVLKPTGTVFHLSPSNVDTIFAYAWALSLLAGNNNLIRVSRRDNQQRSALLSAIAALLAEEAHREINERNALFTYDHDDALTTELSAGCQLRVVWGGDQTVSHVRSLSLPPAAREIAFPDRHSAALVGAAYVLELDDMTSVLEGFRRDIYGFHQHACSSPRLVIWLGSADQASRASARLWPALRTYLARRGTSLPVSELMDKHCAIQSMAMTTSVHVQAGSDHRLDIVDLVDPADVSAVMACHSGGGLVLQTCVEDLDAASGWITPKTQTLAYAGIHKAMLHDWLIGASGATPDRVVPLGQSLVFEQVWDGLDLLRLFSRTLVIR